MSRRIITRPLAVRDLDEQARYIASASGIEKALRFYESADTTFELLLLHPRYRQTYPTHDPYLASTRMFPLNDFAQHIVFYRQVSKGIEIVRVVHGSRDIENLTES